MSYRITFNKPIPYNKTENRLHNLDAKLFDYGSTKFFSYKNKYYEIEKDQEDNITGLTIHGNSVADFKSLMNIKNILFAEI